MALNRGKLKQLYAALQKGGYTQDYDTFERGMSGNDNYNNRKQVYDLLTAHGAQIGDTYEDFMELMQSKPQKQTTAKPVRAQKSAYDPNVPKFLQEPQEETPEWMQQPVKADELPQTIARPRDYTKGGALVEDLKQADERNIAGQRERQGLSKGKYTEADVEGVIRRQEQRQADALDKSAEQLIAQGTKEELDKYEQMPLWQRIFAYSSPNFRATDTQSLLEHISDNSKVQSGRAMQAEVEDAREAMDEAERQRVEDRDTDTLLGDAVNKGARTLRGLWGAARKVRTWDMGEGDMRKAAAIFEAAQAYDNGTATPEQEALMEAAAFGTSMQDKYGDALGGMYGAGSTTTQMLPFMLQIAMNPVRGVGGAAQKAATRGITKFLEKRIGKDLAKKWMGKAIGNVAKGAARLTGDAVEALGAQTAYGMPTTLADYYDRMTGTVGSGKDKNGNIVYNGMREGMEHSAGTAFAKAFGNNYLQYQSEMVGEYFAPILKVLNGGSSKLLQKFTPDVVSEFVTGLSNNRLTKLYNDFAKKTKWSGTLGEYAEEVVNNIENAVFIGDMDFSTGENGVFNPKMNWDTFLGVGLFGGVMSGIRTGEYAINRHRLGNLLNDANTEATTMFGEDKWQQMKNAIDTADDKTIGSVLTDAVNGKNQEQAKAIAKYAGLLYARRGENLAEMKNAEEQDEDAPNPLQEAYDKGYAMTEDSDKADAQTNYDLAVEGLQQSFGTDNVDAIFNTVFNENNGQQIGAGLVDRMRESGQYNDAQMQAIDNFMQARATYYGMAQHMNEEMESQVKASNATVRQHTDAEDGMIHEAALFEKNEDGTPKKVYVVKGSVATADDGKTVVASRSSDHITIVDAATGEKKMVSPDVLSTLELPMDAEQVRQEAENNIRAEYTQKQNDILNGTVGFNFGDTYTMLDDEGVEMQLQVTADPKTGLVENPDGTVNMLLDGQIAALPKALVQAMVDNSRRNRLTQQNAATTQTNQQQVAQNAPQQAVEAAQATVPAYEAGQTVTLTDEDGQSMEVTVQRISEDGVEVFDRKRVAVIPQNEFEAMLAKTASFSETSENSEHSENSEVEAQPQTARSRVPKDEKGNPIYEQTEPETAWDAIVEETMQNTPDQAKAEQIAQTAVGNMVKAKEAALKRAEKATAKTGTTMAEMIAAEQERQQNIDNAKAELEHWKKIAGEQQRRKDAAEARAKEEAAKQLTPTEERLAQLDMAKTAQEQLTTAKRLYGNTDYGYLLDDLEPQTVEELVANNLGAHTLNWEGMDGKRGLQQELGLKRGIGRNYDTNAVNYFIAPNGQGASVDEVAHAIWEARPESLENVTTEDIKNAMLDMLASAGKATDISRLTLNNRIAQIEQYLQGEEAANEEHARQEAEAAEQQAAYQEYMDYLESVAQELLSTEDADRIRGIIADEMADMEAEEALMREAALQGTADYEQQIRNNESDNQQSVSEGQGVDNEPEPGAVQGGTSRSQTAVRAEEPSQQQADAENQGKPQPDTRAEGAAAGTGHADGGVSVPGEGSGTVRAAVERGGQGNLRDAAGREQGDLAQAGEVSYKLSDEVDENGRQFVLAPNGELSFGDMRPATGLTQAPILLSEGIITNPATGDGYGLVHIEARHGDQIRQAGYKSVLDFISEVAKNYDRIVEGSVRDGNQTYMLQLRDKHNNTLMVELSGDGTYWNINTAGIFKTSYGKNRKEVYNRHTTATQPAETVETSQNEEQSGTHSSSRMNVPTSSTGKVSESSDTKQVNEEISDENSSTQAAVETAEQEVDTHPTDAQKEAGNYKKGHVEVAGFDITIENPKGSERSGTDANGKKWSITMQNSYGYIRGTEGVDGDHIDVFLADDLDAWDGSKVYVVDQYNADGTFDEHKVMLGFNDTNSAYNAYLSNYSDGWEKGRKLHVSEVSFDDFKKWVDSSHRKTKPFAEYKSVQKVAEQPSGKWYGTPEEMPGYENMSRSQKRTLLQDAAEAYRKGNEEATKDNDFFGGRQNEMTYEDFVHAYREEHGDFGIKHDGLFLPALYEHLKGKLDKAVETRREVRTAAPVESQQQAAPIEQPKRNYTVEPAKYTTKRGKVLDMQLVKFDFLQASQQKAAASLARSLKGWWDKSQKGFMLRNEEDVKTFVDAVNEESGETLADHAPLSLADLKESTPQSASEEESQSEKKEDVFQQAERIAKEEGERLEKQSMAARIGDWLSKENLSQAYGKTRDEIFEEFGNELEPIASVPAKYLSLISPNVSDPHIYCGKGYFIDHALRNHGKAEHQVTPEEVDASQYLNMQSVLDNPDSIKETTVDGKRTVVFIKKIGRYYAELTQAEEDGKIVLHKSLFNQKKEPYAKLNDIRQKESSSEGGASSISHADNSAPAISLQSRGDEVSSETPEQKSLLNRPNSDQYPTAREVSADKVTANSDTKQENSEKKEQTKQEEKPKNPSGNKLVTDERYEELKKRMREKLLGQMNMGVDPEILAIGTEMAVYHIEKGARKFAEYAKGMIADMGDAIRPYLKAFYEGTKNMPEIEENGWYDEMTPSDEVRKFDVANFDKPTVSAIATAETVAKEQEVAKQAEEGKEKLVAERNKKRKKSVSSQQPSLFDDLNTNDNEQVHIQNGRPAAEREERPEHRQNEPLGESQRNEVERTDGQRMGGRSSEHPVPERERGGRVSGLSESEERLTQPKNARNNHGERGVEYAPKSVDARIEANVKAIELAQQLLENGEQATPQQMAVLRKFSGWGGLGKAFQVIKSPWSGEKLSETAQRVQNILGAEAYEQASMSSNSSFYTPTAVIDSLWDIARKVGFKGGKVLEGSAGIGNILAQMPTDMSERSDIEAVEIDPTAGGILSLLYPDAKVQIQGFEQTKIANNSVDLAITNVPFVTGLHVKDETGDKDLSKKFRNIHDFCIAKNVRKLREGGIGIFITSSGTLDNSQKLRNWLVSDGNADVVGAFRLNNKTFGSATAVTSDIIVVRKRVNGKPSSNAIDVSTVSVERTSEPIVVKDRNNNGYVKTLPLDYNRYFIEHPEMMAGEMFYQGEKGDDRRPTSKGLYPVKGKEQEKMLQAFVESLSDLSDNSEVSENSEAMPDRYAELGESVKEGSMVVSDGKLCIAQGGKAVPLAVNANKVKGHTKVECFEAYSAIKDAVNAVLDYQTLNADDAGLKPLLKKLNKAYDDFVKTYGHLHKNTAISFLKNDIEFPSIAALEKFTETGDEKGNRVQTFEKTDIFNRRVVEKASEPHPTNVKDGVVVSIQQHGRIDVPYIAEQLGKSEDEVVREIVKEGLGFEDPVSGEVEVSFKYKSGNVREKLRQAQENNESGQYDPNIKALQKVMPMDIPAHLIEFTLGSSWVSPKLYEDYVKDRTGINVKLALAGGQWYMDEPYQVRNEQNKAFGVYSEQFRKDIYGHQLIEAAIQNKTIVVQETHKTYDGGKETVTDKEATAACAAKVDEIRQDFKDWARQKMQSDTELSAEMERTYNEVFNNYVPLTIPQEFIPKYFDGASHRFDLRPHQGAAAVRATMQPLMLAHEVGTGKTFTLITTAMEMRRLGTAKKPMIVVQNATVAQFVADAKALYPNAKVLTLSDKDREKEGRKDFYAKIRYNDWDMIVVPQSTLDMIPDSEERQMAYIQDKIDEKMLVLQQMKEAGSNGNDYITKQAEREIEQLKDQLSAIASGEDYTPKKKDKKGKSLKDEAKTRQNAAVKAQEMLDRKTDDTLNFEEMGIDAILVDEAHEYKHLGFATAMQRGVKGVDPSYSKKSQGVYLKCQAVLEKSHGKNVVFATGTPISNTAAEVWTFMRYLMPADTMKEYGIYYFDDFVRNFGNLQQMLEFNTNGRFKEVNRFSGYTNLPELQRIWLSVADTVKTEDNKELQDKIPEMESGKAQDLYLPQTKALRSVMKYVKERLEDYEKMSGKEKKANSHIPLTMYGIAKAAAVDARLVLNDAADESNSKTNEAVRQTLRTLKETADYKGTVAIFADNYQNKVSGFNLYEDIKRKLVEQGVPAEQIAIIKSGMTINRKQDIFDKVNSGEIRVVMGSTFTLGTGVNIQERLHTLIHVDAPNRPMDYTQRNGRILRQGNLHRKWNKAVRVLRFGVEDSLDVTAYQRLKTKGAIADSIMNGKKLLENSMTNRVLEEEEDVFGDTVAQLSGSEYAMLKNQAEKEVRKLEARMKQWEADQIYIHNAEPRLRGQIKADEERAAANKGYLAKVEKDFPGGTFKAIKVGKNTFGSVDEMGDFFKEHNKTIKEAQDKVRDTVGATSVTRNLTLDIDGVKFEVTTTITHGTGRNGASLFSTAERNMTYSCAELGLEDVPVKNGYVKNAVEDIVQNVLTGTDFKERMEAAEAAVERNKKELETMLKRKGGTFDGKADMEKAKEKLDEYTEKMKEELAAKEAKYAEMDAEVETATDVVEAEEDSEEANEKALAYIFENDGQERNISRIIPDDVEKSVSLRIEKEFDEKIADIMSRVPENEQADAWDRLRDCVNDYSKWTSKQIQTELRNNEIADRSQGYSQESEEEGERDSVAIWHEIAKAAAARELDYRRVRQNRLEDVYGIAAGKRLGYDVLEKVLRLSENGRDKAIASLFDKARSICGRLGVRPLGVEYDVSRLDALGVANIDREILLSVDMLTSTSTSSTELPVVIVHEMLHQGTMAAISLVKNGRAKMFLTPKQIEGVQTILDIYESVKDNRERFKENTYGLKDEYEFAAQMADPRQRRALDLDVWQRVMNAARELLRKGDASLWQRLKNAIGKLFELSDKAKMDEALNKIMDDFNEVVHDIAMNDIEEGGFGYKVTDKKELERLNSEDTFKMYSTVQEVDGVYASPMAGYEGERKKQLKLTNTITLHDWYRSDESELNFTPEQQAEMEALDDGNKKGQVVLVKNKLRYFKGSPNGKGTLQFWLQKTPDSGLWANYNPYNHTSTSMMNDQFTGAYGRSVEGNKLVVAEWDIPTSEKTSGYQAPMAHDAEGFRPWHSGVVNALLPEDRQRSVMLSRHRRMIRIVPYAEQAKSIADQLKGTGLAIPWNTHPYQVIEELAKLGVPITTIPSGTVKAAHVEAFNKQKAELEKKYPQARFVNVRMTQDDYEVWGKDGGTQYREGDTTEKTVSEQNDPYIKMGADRFTQKQRDDYNARQARRVQTYGRTAAESLAEKLHLKPENFEVLGSEELRTKSEELSDAQKRAKGFFNTRTGKITVILGNHQSVADVEKTVLHEAVAHYGLRQLFGKQFDTFLDNVYAAANGEVRTRIAELAKKHKWNFHTATEEYLASLAESTDFERAMQSGWWNKIKELFMRMLHSIGFEGYADKAAWRFSLSDNELRYILWRSYENLAEPGRYRSILGKAADVAKQYELGVGNFTSPGPSEVGERAAEGGLFSYFNGSMAELIAKAKQSAQGLIKKVVAPVSSRLKADLAAKGVEVDDSYKHVIDNNAIRHTLKHHGSQNEVKRGQMPITAADFERIPEIVAEYDSVTVEDGKRGEKNIIYSKTFADGTTLFVEEKRDNRKELAAVTMWKKKKPTLTDANRHDATPISDLSELSDGKVTTNVSDMQASDEDVLFRDGDDLPIREAQARDAYERRVKTSWYQTKEAMQDSMLGLKEGLQAILQAEDGKKNHYMEDIAGFENPYLGENRLSSVNQAEMEAMERLLFKPMYKEVAKLAKGKAAFTELTDYMMAKHGLERNEVMARREAEKEAREEFAKELRKAERAAAKDAADQKAIDELEDVKQRMHDREEELYYEKRGRDYAGLTALMQFDSKEVGLAEAEAQKLVKDYEADHDTTALWKSVKAVNEAILSKQLDGGIISKETYADIKGMYKNYIPLRGFEETTSADKYAYLQQGGQGYNAPIKKAKGRSSKADNPFAYMLSMAESGIMGANRNVLVKQRMLNFALNHPSDLVSVSQLWLKYDDVADEWVAQFPDTINDGDSPAEVEQKVKAFEAHMEQLAEQAPDHYAHGKQTAKIPYRVVEKNEEKQHQVIVKRFGQDYVLTINGNPRMAQALNGKTNPDSGEKKGLAAALRFGEAVNRQLSAFYTTRNPDFVLSNFLRDALYSNTMAWVKESPKYALRFHKNFAAVNPGRMKVLLKRYEKGTLDMNDATDKMFYQFMMNGGETGYTALRDIEQHKKDAKKGVKRAGQKVSVGKGMEAVADFLDEWNRAVENCARFAAFKTSREMGRTIDRCIYDAKEISVNFNKKGSGAKFQGETGQTWLGNTAAFASGAGRASYVFWNAALQGTTNFARQFKRHPAKALAGAASLFLLGAMVAAMGGDGDDDDKNAYYNLPEYVRRSNFMKRVGGQWVSLPLPVEYRLFYGMGELAASVIGGNEHMTDGEIAMAVASQLSQALPLDFLEGGGDWKNVLPSAVKPIAETAANKSWTGMPIYKDTPYNKEMPEWTKAYKSANKYLVGLSEALNEATGGDKYTSGAVDINPAQVEYFMKSMLGGVTTTIDEFVKTGETLLGEREYDPRSFMFLNRVVENGDERTEFRAINNEYFRLKEEAERTKSRMKHYDEERKRGDERESYRERYKTLRQSPQYERLRIYERNKKRIDELSDQMKEARTEERMKRLEQRLNERKKRFVNAVEATYEK